MSLHRQFVSAFAWLSIVAVCATVSAQQLGPFGHHHGQSANIDDFYDPFYEIDADWFEPIYGDSPDERPINSGWFFSYDRVNLNVSRPRDEPGQLFFDPGTVDSNPIPSSYIGSQTGDHEGDWALGNRFDFGYTAADGTGLWFIARKLDNPNRVEQIINTDSNDDVSNRPDGEPWGDTFVTLNGFNMWGIEMNKVWRLPPTPKGTILEPFVGPRYVRLRDHADRDDVYTDTLGFPLVGIPGETRIDRFDFNFQQNRVTTDNNLFGGQFGVRSRWRRGRWQVVSDIRGLLFQNRRQRERFSQNEIQSQDFTGTYGADGLGGGILNAVATSGPLTQYQSQTTVYDSSTHFVYGGELNLETTFEVTRGFALRAGAEIIAFADGVGRGITATDDSVVLAGFSIGFSLNR